MVLAAGVTLAFAAVACGHHFTDDGDMTHEADLVMTHSGELDTALDAHTKAAIGAPDLAAVAREEAAYADAMRGHMGDLEHAVADMGGYCMGSIDRERMDDMREAMRSLRAEHDRHRAVVRTDMSMVGPEEERHAREVDALMKRLRAGSEWMRHGSSSRCRHCC
jgi:hypothetical protein